MRLRGTKEELWEQLKTPAIVDALQQTEHARGKMGPHQYAFLYHLAEPYNGGRILDIGAFKGRSALVLSYACPDARIVTLEPYRFDEARRNTRRRRNITVVKEYSWRYLAAHPKATFDLVLVDGNHKKVQLDIPWFNRLACGGLILFHDYSPVTVPHVYRPVNNMGRRLGREPDVLLMDEKDIGIAGFYRREAERYMSKRSGSRHKGGKLVEVEIEPGRFVKCHPGDEEKVLQALTGGRR